MAYCCVAETRLSASRQTPQDYSGPQPRAEHRKVLVGAAAQPTSRVSFSSPTSRTTTSPVLSTPPDITKKGGLMGSVNVAMDMLGLGPRGGNLNNPHNNPERRNTALSAKIVGDNVIGLHDGRKSDSAMPGLLKEQPWHRMAAHMLNRAFTNIEVADAAGVTVQSVSTLRAQRWFNELCATLAENKEQVIKARLDGYALDAVEAIAATAFSDDPEIPERVKLTARTTLLEHSQGRPTQKVLTVSASTTFSSEREEYDAIMQELKTTGARLLSGTIQPGGESAPTNA